MPAVAFALRRSARVRRLFRLTIAEPGALKPIRICGSASSTTDFVDAVSPDAVQR